MLLYSVKDLRFPLEYFNSINYSLKNYRNLDICKVKPTKCNKNFEPDLVSFFPRFSVKLQAACLKCGLCKIVGEGGGYFFNSSPPLSPASQALRH